MRLSALSGMWDYTPAGVVARSYPSGKFGEQREEIRL